MNEILTFQHWLVVIDIMPIIRTNLVYSLEDFWVLIMQNMLKELKNRSSNFAIKILECHIVHSMHMATCVWAEILETTIKSLLPQVFVVCILWDVFSLTVSLVWFSFVHAQNC